MPDPGAVGQDESGVSSIFNSDILAQLQQIQQFVAQSSDMGINPENANQAQNPADPNLNEV